MKILKGIGTTTFVATRVALICAAGLVIVGTIDTIKDRFSKSDDECVAPEPAELESVIEN